MPHGGAPSSQGFGGERLSVQARVLGSGSRGNSTPIATERTRVLVDAGFSRRETRVRLATVGQRADSFDALVVSHEHSDHIRGLAGVVLESKAPIYLTAATHQAIPWDRRLTRFEHFPAYAPELNPDEGVCALAKRDLANGCPLEAEDLRQAVFGSINEIRRSPERLRGCILESGLPHFLPQLVLLFMQKSIGSRG